jgi:pimeloyl-ACP methyl ester carboxylesterase
MPAMQTASTRFRAYAIDMWGFGDTARDPARYGIDKQVSLLDHFLQELGMGKVAIVGHGLGGLVGLLFTLRYPTVVDRIMAVGVPFDPTAINNRLRSSSLQELVDWLLIKDAAAEPARTDGLKADPLALSTFFSSPDLFNFSQRMSSMHNPCLLVHGQNDPAIGLPVFDPDRMHLNLHSVVLEQSAHFPMLDDPARFNRLLTDFLALDSGESPRDLLFKEEWKRRVR